MNYIVIYKEYNFTFSMLNNLSRFLLSVPIKVKVPLNVIFVGASFNCSWIVISKIYINHYNIGLSHGVLSYVERYFIERATEFSSFLL